MKSPREILLRKHRAAVPQLDAIREQTLAALSHSPPRASRASLGAVFREWFALPKPVWVALGAAWVVIVALNFSAADDAPSAATTVAEHGPGWEQAMAEQRRLYAELVHAPIPANAPGAVLKPRSERGVVAVAV